MLCGKAMNDRIERFDGGLPLCYSFLISRLTAEGRA